MSIKKLNEKLSIFLKNNLIENSIKSENIEVTPGNIHNLANKNLPKEDIDHHETDLYIRKTPESEKLINKLKNKSLLSTFKDNIDGDIWYELPFCYNKNLNDEKITEDYKPIIDWSANLKDRQIYIKVAKDVEISFDNLFLYPWSSQLSNAILKCVPGEILVFSENDEKNYVLKIHTRYYNNSKKVIFEQEYPASIKSTTILTSVLKEAYCINEISDELVDFVNDKRHNDVKEKGEIAKTAFVNDSPDWSSKSADLYQAGLKAKKNDELYKKRRFRKEFPDGMMTRQDALEYQDRQELENQFGRPLKGKDFKLGKMKESTDYVYELQNRKTGQVIWSHTSKIPGYKFTGNKLLNDPDKNDTTKKYQSNINKEKSINEISLELADKVNTQRQVNALKANIQALKTNNKEDKLLSKEANKKAAKNNKLFADWKASKNIQEAEESVVATFEDADKIHKIIKNKDGKYNVLFDIKNNKARKTTQGVSNLPTALTTLQKQCPNAKEITDKE